MVLSIGERPSTTSITRDDGTPSPAELLKAYPTSAQAQAKIRELLTSAAALLREARELRKEQEAAVAAADKAGGVVAARVQSGHGPFELMQALKLDPKSTEAMRGVWDNNPGKFRNSAAPASNDPKVWWHQLSVIGGEVYRSPAKDTPERREMLGKAAAAAAKARLAVGQAEKAVALAKAIRLAQPLQGQEFLIAGGEITTVSDQVDAVRLQIARPVQSELPVVNTVDNKVEAAPAPAPAAAPSPREALLRQHASEAGRIEALGLPQEDAQKALAALVDIHLRVRDQVSNKPNGSWALANANVRELTNRYVAAYTDWGRNLGLAVTNSLTWLRNSLGDRLPYGDAAQGALAVVNEHANQLVAQASTRPGVSLRPARQ